MNIFPDWIETPHEVQAKTGDGRDLYIASGYACFSYQGHSEDLWRCDPLLLDLGPDLGPQWWTLEDRNIVPIISLASIFNVEHAINAGWAVDNCRGYAQTDFGPVAVLKRIRLEARICVRDVDGFLFRVAYHVTAVGKLLTPGIDTLP